ncbi:MAG: hypothetical protein ACP5D6_06470 [Kosmotogaceae bacterium]
MVIATKEIRGLIDSGISLQHVQQWTMVEALREIIQNYLDAKHDVEENTGETGGEILWNNGYLIMHDYGPGLEPCDFAFGYNDKSEGSIGMFGEGLKSGLVTAARNDRNVTLEFGGTKVSPRIAISNAFGIPTLHYEFDDNPFVEGTRATVECTEAEYEQAKKFFSELDPEIRWIEVNEISYPSGYIYVNRSRVAQKQNMMFSYHLFSKEASEAISRDRDNINDKVLEKEIRNLIENTASKILIKNYFKGLLKDKDQPWETTINVLHINRLLWKEVWDKHFAHKLYAISIGRDADKQAEHRGYIVLRWKGYYNEQILKKVGVPNTRDVARSTPRKGIYQLEDLTLDERKILEDSVKDLSNLYDYSLKLSDIIIGELPADVPGEYNKATGQITLSRSILRSYKECVSTLAHEVAHKRSGASDLTQKFEDELTSAIGKIIFAAVEFWKKD